MGALFRPKYRAADGTVKESPTWWVRFRQHGKTLRQSANTSSHAKAKAFLRQQEGKVAFKIPVNVEADRLALADAAEMILQDYQTNGRKSAATLPYRLAQLHDHFGAHTRLSRLTTGAVETYKTHRLEAGAQPATVNREPACLKRTTFVATRLEERNARQGFFEDEQWAAILRALPERVATLAAVARITGWRRGELRSRQWRHVDFEAGRLRLEPEETKNRDGRMFPLPWVFFKEDGTPIGDFKTAWRTARRKAGIPGHLFHDLRRTVVRNLERAGVSRSSAMRLTGHRTESVYRRYAIVAEGDLREAADKLARLGVGDGCKVPAKGGKVARLTLGYSGS